MPENKIAVLMVCLTIVAGSGDATIAQGPEEIVCTGRIIDAQSQPLEGAKVTLYIYTRQINPFSDGISPTEKVTTGPDGSFTFDVPADNENYPYGYIVAEKKGFALGWAYWNMRKGGAELEIELGQPNTLGGTVVDENNEPVSGSRVSIYLMQKNKQYLTSPLAPMLLTTTTDPKGNFIFGDLPAGTTADLLVRKTGRANVNTSMASPRRIYAVARLISSWYFP